MEEYSFLVALKYLSFNKTEYGANQITEIKKEFIDKYIDYLNWWEKESSIFCIKNKYKINFFSSYFSAFKEIIGDREHGFILASSSRILILFNLNKEDLDKKKFFKNFKNNYESNVTQIEKAFGQNLDKLKFDITYQKSDSCIYFRGKFYEHLYFIINMKLITKI